ncbi:50S ribosomal protein L15 [Longibacter salinarum]|uniref:Large ribosomal subunit protein uL15 n=1 Tax=Longibacter salinarum TaxID=1850348 RepID=A0A2A8D314_9BACT|nr:50S ribosomal protein L15 [Longibacter salinarum]PEN15352.1 50S ribosomal protein L15 [Longibacter salinarum]
MDLSNLKPAEGATKDKQRLGRGVGSGRGGHQSTRGDKGQSSRSGSKNRPMWFEGGQMPLYRRLPKFGFTNNFRVEPSIVNVSRIARLVNDGRIDASEPVTPEVLDAAGAIRDPEYVKILGDGEIDVALEVSAHAFSESAKKKIEDAGGSVTDLDA